MKHNEALMQVIMYTGEIPEPLTLVDLLIKGLGSAP